MNKNSAIVYFTILLLIVLAIPNSFAEEPKLPNWIKNIFVWYGEGQISEDDVLNAIKFLVENQIIQIDAANQSMEMMNQGMMKQNMSFNVDVPVIMPMIDGYFNGNKVYFVHTEISDSTMTDMMSNMINFPTLYVPELKNISEDQMAKVYVFTNGISGSEPYGGGPFMYQIDVFDSIPGQAEYSQFRIPYLVTWNDDTKPIILTSEAAILKAESGNELTIEKSALVVNAPMITWEMQGNYGKTMEKITMIPRMFESMSGVEGELTFVDVDRYVAIFKLHSDKEMNMMDSTMMAPFQKNDIVFTLQGDDTVGNINSETFDAGPKMTYISASSTGDLILATSSASDTVYAFDNNGNKLASITVGKTPKGVKIHPFENMAFVANENSGSISVINTETFQVTKEIPVGMIPHNIRFSPDGNTAYVTLQGGDAVTIIDVNSLKVVDSIPVEKYPHNLDISPDGKYLFTANIGTSDVAVIDLSTNEIIKRIPVSTGHHGIDVSPDGKRVYVSGIGSNLVNVIDVKSLELIKTIPVGDGPHGLRTSLDNSKLYVGVTGTNEIVIIDTKSLTIQEHISVGNTPFWIASPGNY